MAKDGGENSHDSECTKCGRKDEHARMAHSHKRSDKESLVTNLGENNHGKR